MVLEVGPEVMEVMPEELSTKTAQAAGVASAVGTEDAMAVGTAVGQHGRNSD